MTLAAFESSSFHFPHALSGTPYTTPNANVRRSVRQIGIVLFDEFSLLRAGFIAEVFQLANQLAANNSGQSSVAYRVRLLSLGGGVVLCSSALGVGTERLDSRQYGSYDALFTAGGKVVGHAEYEDARFYKMPHSSSELSFSSMQAPAKANGDERGHDTDERYESLSAALTLIKRDLGLDVAREIGERLLPGASLKLSPLLRDAGTSSVREKIRASARWIDANCERAISVVDAAQVAAMSERNYLRRFKHEMGIPPSEYLFRVRLDMVCRLLTETDLPVDKIARRSGMGNGDRLAKIFRKRLLISPTEYRLRNNLKALRA
jgi:transcriptional regulator GlxA family with amidase domain